MKFWALIWLAWLLTMFLIGWGIASAYLEPPEPLLMPSGPWLFELEPQKCPCPLSQFQEI